MKHRGRSGIAYVLAMLYVLLFTVLAIGFFAASATSMHIAANERAAANAQAAAESGMQFAESHLRRIHLDPTRSETPLLQQLADSLARQLDGSANMNGSRVAIVDGVIYLPGPDQFLSIDPATGQKVQLRITEERSRIRVKAVGRGRSATIDRAIQLDFAPFVSTDIAKHEAQSGLQPVATTYEEVTP